MWTTMRTLYHYLSFLPAWEKKRLQRVLAHACAHIPYYKEFAGMPLKAFPVMNKNMMQAQFAAFNSQGFTAAQILKQKNRDFLVHRSLGTTGESGIYISSQAEYKRTLENILQKMLPPSKNPRKIAVFYYSETPYLSSGLLNHNSQWQFFNLHRNWQNILSALKKFNPTVLIAPVQTLYQLALLQQKKVLSLVLEKIFATAEVLTSLEEGAIMQSFAQPVHQLYQCAEGWLGTTCEYGTLHLNQELFYIEKEWIDKEQQRFIPVITALERFVQPLIRYRMDDILKIKAEPCYCGSALLGVERIVGRCEDVLYFPHQFNSHTLKPLYADTLYDALRGMMKYQVLQSSPYQIEMKIQTSNNKAVIDRLNKLCKNQEIRMPNITFSVLDDVPLHQKFRQTKRVTHENMG